MKLQDINRLDQLWHLREDRARQIFEEQQLAMDKAKEALQEQRQLITDLEQQLEEAARRRIGETLSSAAAFQSEAMHRRALRSDLGRERYYREVLADDVRQERRKLNKCRADWLREHGRLDRIPVLKANDMRSKTRLQLRQDSDLFDELFARPSELHGEHA